MVQQWDGLYALTHFGSMAEFWAWAQGDGRSTFRDAPPLPGAIEAIKRIGAKHRVVHRQLQVRLGHPRLAGLAGRPRGAGTRGALPVGQDAGRLRHLPR